MPDEEMISIPYKELTKLLDIRREHYRICELFQIPLDKRGEAWVSIGIIERITTYLTGYVGRRSVVERENGAGLRPLPEKQLIEEHIHDPILDKSTNP